MKTLKLTFSSILILTMLCGCSFLKEKDSQSKLEPIEFSVKEYITDDYAISYQIPNGFKLDGNQNVFHSDNSDEQLAVFSYCDMEKTLKKEDILISTMLENAGEKDISIYKKESYNGNPHLLAKNEDGSKYVMITNRVIPAPGGDVYTGVMITLTNSQPMDEAKAEHLFKYMQVLIKARK